MGSFSMWIFALLALLSISSKNLYGSDILYDHHTTQDVDTESPGVEYQDILFQATELIISSNFQLERVKDAYKNTNWTNLKEMKIMPDVFNRTMVILDRINRTLERKVDLGFYYTDKDLSDPIDKVTVEKLTDCFREMKKYVDKFRTAKGFEDKDLWKGTIEMRVQINAAIQELESEVPDILQKMRLLRNRVTKGPY